MPDQHSGARTAGTTTTESSTYLESKPARKHFSLVA